jgi:hypothetical protein
MSTTVVTSTTISGVTFVLDVTSLELTSDINIRDFKVTHNGIDTTSSYAKTSASQLTYTGASVVLGTLVRATRATPLTTSETTFITTTTANELTNALTKLHRRVDELQAYLNYQTQLLIAGGISVGASPVNNDAYGVAWNNDSLQSPSRDAVYDRVQQLLTGVNTISGNNTISGANNFTGANTFTQPIALANNSTATTQAQTDDSTKIATTAFAHSVLRPVAIVHLSANATITGSVKIPMNVATVNVGGAWNTTSNTFTAPKSGYYLAGVRQAGSVLVSGISATLVRCSTLGDIRLSQLSLTAGTFPPILGSTLVRLGANETLQFWQETFGGGASVTWEGGSSGLSGAFVIYLGKE